ncbi:uncharacterized protein LOC130947647 [Arachis stenosperma]|uniref:uncharacterized protein LOC130947647 n=1 Tax=Arachis stenosperma TaxID=217475 RepID=UPI0025AD45C4|nr:uncharacterized protein LOC130947647 [Arachis stenosperma]
MADASDCDGFNPAATRKNGTEKKEEKDMPLSQQQEEEERSVLDSEQALALPGSELEAKKQRLLEELESALLPKTKLRDSMNCNNLQDLPLSSSSSSFAVPVATSIGLGLGIQVIDETAVFETFALPSASSASSGTAKGKGTKAKAKANADVAVKKDGNKKSNSRRKAKKNAVALKQHNNMNGKKNATGAAIPNGTGKKRRYSRKEMEALRFVNEDKQRFFWNEIYRGLQPHVANEYDTLFAVASVPYFPNKKPTPPILSSCENTDAENGSAVDSSCSHSVISEDGCSNLEEHSEEDDTDDDYASIQRPAFFVDGEPDFDSGPPEDGWEYLRRVRWEADQIPKVKVAKLDRSKLNKEQSAYMPKIPDIAKCPEHLLPSKQWEDVFLADFSALRASISAHECSNAMNSSNMQTVQTSQLLENNSGESASVMNKDKDVPLQSNLSDSKTIDPPLELTSEDKDATMPLENPGSKTSVDGTRSSSLSPPMLSSVLRMDPVARVSMLLKRISLLESASTISRNDCIWLFALCASVDTPLYADTSAGLRSLLRKCASIRAGKAELDEEVVMLNILATISGKYFGQSEG